MQAGCEDHKSKRGKCTCERNVELIVFACFLLVSFVFDSWHVFFLRAQSRRIPYEAAWGVVTGRPAVR